MSDLFSQVTEIVSRLTSQISTATTYYGSQIVGANSQAASMPGLIVAPGEAAPVDETLPPRSTGGIERQLWRVGVRCKLDTGAAQASRVEHVIGALSHSVINALHGYRFTTGTPSLLTYRGRDEMLYAPDAGYAEVWLRFSAERAIS